MKAAEAERNSNPDETLKLLKSEGADSVDWHSLDDDILIKAFLKGEATAFEVLFKKYRDHVARLVYSIIKEESLVEDIVQEVFLLVYRNLAKFRQQAAFKTWLYRITVNEAMRQIGRARRWQTLPEGDQEPANLASTFVMYENGDSPERLLIDSEQKRLVHRALDSMKPNHKLILTLYYLEDQSVQEIANILGIPEGSVKSRLYYAREGLKKVLDPVLERAQSFEVKNAHVL
jgi:RNA polymerase sigma-70 factor (ECF subfamily)